MNNMSNAEYNIAIQEAERNHAADAYFSARPQLLKTTDQVRMFEAGFDRGYQPVLDIKAAIEAYYDDLNNRQHGGQAQNTAFEKIESILHMTWQQYNRLEQPHEHDQT